MGFEKTSLLHFWFCSHCPLLNFLWRQRLLGLRRTPSLWYGKPWDNIAIKTQKMNLRKHKHVVVVVVVVVLVKWDLPILRKWSWRAGFGWWRRRRERESESVSTIVFVFVGALSPPWGCGVLGSRRGKGFKGGFRK